MPYKNEVTQRLCTTTCISASAGSPPAVSSSSSVVPSRSFQTAGSNRNSPIGRRIGLSSVSFSTRRVRGPKIGYEIVVVKKGEKVTVKGKTYRSTRDYTYRRAVYLWREERDLRPHYKKLTGLLFNSFETNSYEVFPHGATKLTAKHQLGPQHTRSVETGYSFNALSGFPGWYVESFSNGFSWGSNQISSAIATMETWKPGMIAEILRKSKDQSVNIAQAVAESDQTRKMIIDLSIRLAQTLLKLKKLDFKGAFSTVFPTNSKNLSSDVLTWQYGIRPLISDIDGAMKQLAKKSNFEEFDITCSRSVLKSYPTNFKFSSGLKGSTSGNLDVELKLKLKVKLKLTNDTTRLASSLGLTNPLSLGYELIPFSFVVDWILPIGEYLNSMDSFLGIDIVDAHWTYIVIVNGWETTMVSGADNSGYIWDPATFGFSVRRKSIQRVLIQNPSSTFTPPFPAFKNPFSYEHLVNAMALFRQLR